MSLVTRSCGTSDVLGKVVSAVKDKKYNVALGLLAKIKCKDKNILRWNK